MPETIIYEIESMINSLQLGLFKKAARASHADYVWTISAWISQQTVLTITQDLAHADHQD